MLKAIYFKRFNNTYRAKLIFKKGKKALSYCLKLNALINIRLRSKDNLRP